MFDFTNQHDSKSDLRQWSPSKQRVRHKQIVFQPPAWPRLYPAHLVCPCSDAWGFKGLRHIVMRSRPGLWVSVNPVLTSMLHIQGKHCSSPDWTPCVLFIRLQVLLFNSKTTDLSGCASHLADALKNHKSNFGRVGCLSRGRAGGLCCCCPALNMAWRAVFWMTLKCCSTTGVLSLWSWTWGDPGWVSATAALSVTCGHNQHWENMSHNGGWEHSQQHLFVLRNNGCYIRDNTHTGVAYKILPGGGEEPDVWSKVRVYHWVVFLCLDTSV